jgi:hypothetical protein
LMKAFVVSALRIAGFLGTMGACQTDLSASEHPRRPL